MFQFLEVMEQGEPEKEQLGRVGGESERMWWKLSEGVFYGR